MVDPTSDVRYTGEAIDSESDLDWHAIGNYGTDREVVDYLLNHDGACDFEEINDSAEIEVREVCGKGLIRK